jgi:hypothetical protein
MPERNLRTIPQFVERNPAFCPTALRSLVANRHKNGFADVVIKIGRRVYIDQTAFWRWLERVREP